MKKIKFFVISISIVFLLTTIPLNTCAQDPVNNSNPPTAELPSWNPGNKWWYDMEFHYFTDLFSIDAEIDNMLADFDEIVYYQNNEMNKLLLSGDISGKITFGPFNLASFEGDFGGYAFVGSSDLGMKKFVFDVDAKISPGNVNLEFEMIMEFSPTFDFFDFPIDPSSETSWTVFMPSVTLSANAKIGILPEMDYF